jgi:hypothetical protein
VRCETDRKIGRLKIAALQEVRQKLSAIGTPPGDFAALSFAWLV